MSVKNKILLAEDDPNLGFVIKDMLQAEGYKVELCKDGQAALKSFVNGSFDLCILDVMMPKKDGFALAEDIRKVDKKAPIIFLTAKNMKEDVIKGFHLGADDYITKPFNTEEFKLRVSAILKRSKPDVDPLEMKDEYKVGKYVFNYKNLTLTLAKDILNLTAKEADILRIFAHHQGVVLTREEILKRVWGDDDYFIGRSMDVFISRLRKYLKEDPGVEIINIHGVGFKMEVN
jgi:DNA-binding response OmpR family regulator